MKSATPKVLHQVAGLPILGHVIAGLKGAGVSRIVVVTAPGADQVRAYATSLGADSVVQDKQLGTGHAAAAAGAALKNFKGEVMVAYGDMPLLTGEAFAAAFATRPKERCTAKALRAEALDVDTVTRVGRVPDQSDRDYFKSLGPKEPAAAR